MGLTASSLASCSSLKTISSNVQAKAQKITAKKPLRANLLAPPKAATEKLLPQRRHKAALLPPRAVRAAQSLQLLPQEAASSSAFKTKKAGPAKGRLFYAVSVTPTASAQRTR